MLRVLIFLLFLIPAAASAQFKLTPADCVQPGGVLRIEGADIPARPRGEIVLNTRPVVELRVRSWRARRIEVIVPSRGLRPGTAYGVEWRVAAAGPRRLGRLELCSDQGSTSTAPPNRDRAPADVVPAPDGSPEYIITVNANQAQAAANALQARGVTVLRNRPLPALGQTLLMVALPGNLSVQAAQGVLNSAAPSARIDLHHIYSMAQSPRLYAAALIGDDPGQVCRLRRPVRVGIIDGPVNPGHPAMAGVKLARRNVLAQGERPTTADHGTAVAQIIAGRAGGPYAGFAQGAQIYAAEAFSRTRGREGARMENVAAGMDWLISQNVKLVNLSMSGRPNQALARLMSRAGQKGVVMVAAAGNDRTTSPRHPAAAPETIAVTAVDAARKIYRQANSGAHIEFAAPGVDLFVASSSGGKYRSGTSYAAPIVTALLARKAASGSLSLNSARSTLRRGVTDLGPAGRDAKFGYGLVSGGC